MKFSNENIKEVVTHGQTIMSIFQFPDNLNHHMVSVSSDGEVKEWREFNSEIIQTVNLKRPSLEFLLKNGHTKEKVPRLKISKFYIFNEKIFCGYEDGLILAWIQKKEDINKDELLTPEKEQDKGEQFLDDSYCYKNVYYLDLILIGHKHQILDLFYYQSKNYLISASADYTIKYWDLKDGSTVYHFNLDTIAMKILQVKDKKTESFMFLCKENVKITINTNIDPVSVNSSNFPFNGINSIFEHNQQYFLACYSPNIVVINSQTLSKETEIVDSECNEIYNVAIWNNFLITLGNDKMIKFWDINKNFKKEFYMEGSKDDSTCLFLKGNFCYFGGYDRKVLKLNIKGESNSNYDRNRMIEEEKFSIVLNQALKAKMNKKGKSSAKGKKPASGSKKPQSGKKPASGKKDTKQASKTGAKKK